MSINVSKSAEEFIYNYPIKVYFAGFTSDTCTLARNGWSLAVHQEHSLYNAAMNIRLALRNGHETSGAYMLSNVLEIDYERFWSDSGNRLSMQEQIVEMGFHIQHFANNIRMVVMPVMESIGFGPDSFTPISGIPEYGKKEFDLSKIRWFKPLNPSIKDILIVEEDIPQVLNMILDVQKTKQDQIRTRVQQKQNMDRYKQMESGIIVKPEEDVKIQIVSCA